VSHRRKGGGKKYSFPTKEMGKKTFRNKFGWGGGGGEIKNTGGSTHRVGRKGKEQKKKKKKGWGGATRPQD